MDNNDVELFSVFLSEGNHWEGFVSTHVGTFKTHDAALEGFINWIETSARIQERRTKLVLLNTLKFRNGNRIDYTKLAAECQPNVSVLRKEREALINHVLREFNFLFGNLSIQIEIRSHKSPKILL